MDGTDDDVVIFCGSGATGAIDKLAQVLGVKIPPALEDRFHVRAGIPEHERPVVFVGPFEHHSNELAWRESAAEVVTVAEDANGLVDLGHLERELFRYADRSLKIGSFSAASNVTEIITDTEQVAILLHRHGALSCWDYAAAGPYLKIDMNPTPQIPDGHLAYKDAIFISHSNFVAALLNDLFGIQSRSGCFCAGPYVHRMYGIDDVWSERMDAEISLGHAGARLAFVRVNFTCFISEPVFDYIVEAIHFVANDGWKFLPSYRFDPFSGLWHHVSGRTRPGLTLHDVSFASGTLEFEGSRASQPESALARYLEEAREIVRVLEATPPDEVAPEPPLTAEFERIRWFPMPHEVVAELRQRSSDA